MRWPNFIHLGPVTIRTGSRYLAKWGFPRLQINGLSFWTWSNGGDFIIASYHPRTSITWLWSIAIMKRSRGYQSFFNKEGRAFRAELFAKGNPHASKPHWSDRLMKRDMIRRSQWTDYYRLPFGFVLSVAQQKAMYRDA